MRAFQIVVASLCSACLAWGLGCGDDGGGESAGDAGVERELCVLACECTEQGCSVSSGYPPPGPGVPEAFDNYRNASACEELVRSSGLAIEYTLTGECAAELETADCVTVNEEEPTGTALELPAACGAPKP